jgi:hypothetical protein
MLIDGSRPTSQFVTSVMMFVALTVRTYNLVPVQKVFPVLEDDAVTKLQAGCTDCLREA